LAWPISKELWHVRLCGGLPGSTAPLQLVTDMEQIPSHCR
jgi:hypothetical protein